MKIYSIHYNKPEYIYLQKKQLDKYIKFTFEFIIIDNSVDFNIRQQISSISEELNLRRIFCNNNDLYMGSLSHLNSFKYLLDDIIDGDLVMIMDHDVFINDHLSEDYYKDFDIVYLPQFSNSTPGVKYTTGSIEYPWPGLVILNGVKNKNQMSFTPGIWNNEQCDTGGGMFKYILDNNLDIKHISEIYIHNNDILMSSLDGIFIHLISGSGWNSNYDLDKKLDIIKNNLLK
jgi:hypothetical protein